MADSLWDIFQGIIGLSMNNNCTCREPIGGTSKFYMPGEIKIVISSAVKFNGYFKYGDLGLFDHIFHI